MQSEISTTNPITLDHIVILDRAMDGFELRLWIRESGFIDTQVRDFANYSACYLIDLVEAGAIALSDTQIPHLPHIIQFTVTEIGALLVEKRQYSKHQYPSGSNRETLDRYIFAQLPGWTMPSVSLSQLGLH